MASRKLEVEIVGDSKSLERAFGRSAQAGSRFGSGLKKVGLIAGAVAAGGIAAVAVGLKKSFDAAADAEVSQKRLQAQLQALGISYKQHGKVIDETLQKHSMLSAFDDEDLADSFSSLVRATGDVNKALDEQSIVMDVARGKGIELTAATQLVTKAGMGQIGALRKVGIEIKAVTTAQDALGKGATEAAKEQAKAADLAATKQEALGLLQQKFAGQAAAYGDTAAGAQERLGVAFENLQEIIGGKLLPVFTPLLNGLTNFINRATQSEAVKEVFQRIGDVLSKVGHAIGVTFEALAASAARNWPKVKKAAEDVANWYRANLQPTFESVSRNIMRVWDNMGKDLQTSLRKNMTRLPPLVQAQLGNLGSVITGSLALLRGDWSTAWHEFGEIPKRTFKSLVDTIKILAGVVRDAAFRVGSAIVEGIKSGIASAWGSLTGWVSGKIHELMDLFSKIPGISSPSKVTIYVGKMLAEGLGVGFGMGMVSVNQGAADKINAAIDHMVEAVRNRRSALGDAFSELAANALAAFDALSSKLMTRMEKRIAKQDAQRAAQERASTLKEAQANAAEARARLEAPMAALTQNTGESDEDFLKRQLDAQEKFNADKEQALADYNQALADAKEAEFQIQRAADEKTAAAERQKLDERQALRRRHLEEQLTNADGNLQKTLAILHKFGIPIGKAANRLGLAVAEGLNDSIAEVRKAAHRLAEALADELEKLNIVISVAVKSGAPPNVKGTAPTKMQSGGITTSEMFAHLHPNEAVIPLNSSRAQGMMGGGGITVNVYGSVTSERDLVLAIRDGLNRMGRWNGGGMLPNA